MVFTGVDVGVAVLVLISAVLATARGFTREILSLATWAGSAALAAYVYFNRPDAVTAAGKDATGPQHAIQTLYDFAHKTLPSIDATLVTVGLVVVVFLVALIVLHLLTMWIGDLVVDSRVGPLDRTLGFVFGAARGVLICVVAAIFATFLLGGTGDKLPPIVKDAKSYPPLMSAGDWLQGLLPPDIETQLTNFLQHKGPEDAVPAEPPVAPVAGDSSEPTDAPSSAPAVTG